jgi:hypothetical protein
MNRRQPRPWNEKPEPEGNVYAMVDRIPPAKGGMFSAVIPDSGESAFRVIISLWKRDRRVKHHVATLEDHGDHLVLRCKCKWKASYASEEVLREEHKKHVAGEDSFMGMPITSSPASKES